MTRSQALGALAWVLSALAFGFSGQAVGDKATNPPVTSSPHGGLH